MAEAAGFVLAVIPLVISGLEHYAAGVSTIAKWWSYKRELNSMCRVLDAEYARFLGTCEKLLHGLPLWGDYHTFKHEFKRVKFSLSRKGYEESMKRIEKNNDILTNLTEQNMELEPARKRRRRGGPEFKSIQKQAKNLYSFINNGWTCNCTKPHQANLRLNDRLKISQSEGSYGSAANDPELSTVFFNVMFSVDNKAPSFESTSLWQETEIHVLENDEIEIVEQTPAEAQEVLKERENVIAVDKRNANGKQSPQPQHLSMLSALSLNAVRPQPKTTKKLGWQYFSKKQTLVPSKPHRKSVQFVKPTSSTSSDFSGPNSKKIYANLVRIENLCLAIHTCMENIIHSHRCLGYLGHEACRLGIYLPQEPQHSHHKQSITTLAQLLSSKQQYQNQYLAATGNLSLRRGDRLGLALTVASSVLQLYKTPWLREYWDKNDIKINGDCITNVREQVYVSKSFPADNSDNSIESTMLPLRNVALFALGIVLIELCLGQPLEALRGPEDPLDSNGKANVLTNWNTANRMTEAVYSEAGTRYGDAVRRCLHCDFDQRTTNLEDDAFRQAVYDGVVAPLEDDVKDFFQL
ncbi:hypothetical protein MMC13_000214 [Lambiella insularis]|nr:hypothetical protein [Lambiella insularis]